MSAIHDAGIVHRDLKPANVLLSSVGPRVIDFGIARAMDARTSVTSTGHIVGTPAYLAPELVTGGRVSAAADVFSWACVVVYAGTGRAPFEGTTVPEILHRVAFDPPQVDGLDPRLRPIVEQALAKDPAQRPTVPRLLAELAGRRATVVEPQPATHPGSVPMRGPRPRAGRTVVAAVALAGVAGLGWWLIPRTSGDETERATPPVSETTTATPSPVIAQSQAPSSGGATPAPAPEEDPGDVPRRVIGTWEGQVYQDGSAKSPYLTIYTLHAGHIGDVIGRARYPSLNCAGELRLLGVSGNQITVREHITDNPTGCIDVDVALDLSSDGLLEYSFDDGRYVGKGTLIRQ
ncbi:protein kinase [Streptosporangiaceae bacterium NEAU-GS5]|nr:protein kinase [Streptosporangiaceae bacterium NEAU-GS5]